MSLEPSKDRRSGLRSSLSLAVTARGICLRVTAEAIIELPPWETYVSYTGCLPTHFLTWESQSCISIPICGTKRFEAHETHLQQNS